MFKNLSQAFSLKKYSNLVKEINLIEPNIKQLSNLEIRESFTKFKKVYQHNPTSQEAVTSIFALSREMGYRSIGLRPFDTQLIGGLVLNEGKIAEMGTGEGKTLVASLPAILNASSNKGVHIITVNRYLAKRDQEWIGQIYKSLGLTVGLIFNEMTSKERKLNYAADITYLTNEELGFDYLRDNLTLLSFKTVRPKFNFCIIDEVDSILIDEARTPLIISGPSETDNYFYQQANLIANRLQEKSHFEVNYKTKNIILNDLGYEIIKAELDVSSLYEENNAWIFYILNALKAKILYLRNNDYIVENNEVIIVDKFTGRIMPGRRWADGLHQAVEIKENVVMQSESETVTSITYRNLFLLYKKLSGMTGTAKTSEKEFRQIYDLRVQKVPPNRPNKRIDLTDVIFFDKKAKNEGILLECSYRYERKQPVLIVVNTIQDSEFLSRELITAQIPHQILNAKPENIRKESKVIAEAGQLGAVTIATNLAGRGTDILLGGNTEFLMKKFLVIFLKKFFHAKKSNKRVSKSFVKVTINKKDVSSINLKYFNKANKAISYSEQDIYNILKLPPNEIKKVNLRSPLWTFFRTNFEHVNQFYKNICFEEKQVIENLGGLFVIGAERNESKRIDNQLRGRTGRQGSPGTSIFMVSLEDELFQLFGGPQFKKQLDNIAFKEDGPLTIPFLDKSLKSIQEKVENFYFDNRKQLYQYDAVLNSYIQKTFIEKKCIRNIDNVDFWAIRYIQRAITSILYSYHYILTEIKIDDIKIKTKLNLYKEFTVLCDNLFYKINLMPLNDLLQMGIYLNKLILLAYIRKTAFYTPGEKYVLKEQIRRNLLLRFDQIWMKHLKRIELLRDSVGWRAFNRKDPLYEYRVEALDVFVEFTFEYYNVICCDLLDFLK